MKRSVNRPCLSYGVVGLLCMTALGATVHAQGPSPTVRQAVQAVNRMLQSEGQASLAAFAEEHFTERYRSELGSSAVSHLAAIREGTRGALGDMGLERMSDGRIRMLLRAERRAEVILRLDDASGKIDRIELAPDRDSAAPANRSEAVEMRLLAVETLGTTPDGIVELRQTHLSPTLVERGGSELDATLAAIARASARAGVVDYAATGAEYVINLRGGSSSASVHVGIGNDAPFLIEALRIDTTSAGPARRGAEVPTLTWGGLAQTFRDAAPDAFSGTVLAVRDGQVVLHESYGQADRDTGRPNTNRTIYGIGSLPIDFTRAAVFLLMQRGALEIDDPITRFYPDASADKVGMTVDHLLSGSSGLPNFHHLPTDADADLTWIDRETAEARILAQTLLFEPGTGTAHSHSAFGLLAAIVERVSGQTYEEFLRANFFRSAGMERTGMYGDARGYAVTDFAVGYGGASVGFPNIPPNWGPTSWLVMGSGGMYSTPEDMYRWFDTLRSGRILQGEALERYLDRGRAIGGSERGFVFLHAWAGGDSMVFLAQNAGAQSPVGSGLRAGLMALVEAEN